MKMATQDDQGLVCDKCLEASPTKKQLISIECFNFKAHKQKRRLVRVRWTGSCLVQVTRRKSTSASYKPGIRPMPDVPLKGGFILCDKARCKGEHCTHPHSIEERDAWNKELLGKDYKASASVKKECTIQEITSKFHMLLRNFPDHEIPLRVFQQNYQTFYHKSFRVSDYISSENAGVRDLLLKCEGIQVQAKNRKGRNELFVCLSPMIQAKSSEPETQGKEYKVSASVKKERTFQDITSKFHTLLRNFPDHEIPLRVFQQNYQTFYHKSFRVSDYISSENAGVRDLLLKCEGIQVQAKNRKGRNELFVCLSPLMIQAKSSEPERQDTTKAEKNPRLSVSENEPDWPSLSSSSHQQGSKPGSVSAWDKPLQSKIGKKIISNKADIRPTKREPKGKTHDHYTMQPHFERKPSLPIVSTASSVIQSLSQKEEDFPPIMPKSSTDSSVSQINEGQCFVNTTPHEHNKSNPVDFQFLETEDEASVNNSDLVFQSQQVDEASHYSQSSFHGELNISGNQSSAGQTIVGQPDPSSQYLMLDDPCIVGHALSNIYGTGNQSTTIVTSQNGTPILQSKNVLSVTTEDQFNWPDFETMPANETSTQDAFVPTLQLASLHGVLQPLTIVDACHASTVASTSMPPTTQIVMSQVQQTLLPVQTESHVQNTSQVLLSQSCYKDVLNACLSEEQNVHRMDLAKCNGEYTMFLYKQGYRPYELYDFEADQFGYIEGLKGGHMVYATQASLRATISNVKTPNIQICSVLIPRSNLSHFDELMYIALDADSSRAAREYFPHARKPQKVYVNFKLKDSYFRTLKQSVACLSVEIIQRILPNAKHFRDHPVSISEIDLGGCERYCLPDHGQLSALKTIVSCPASGPPVLIIGPFGAGKSRILAVAALYFMEVKNGSPSRVLVCMQQRASVESFLSSFVSLIASKEHMEICVVQNYGKPKDESLKKWYTTVDDFKQSSLRYSKPFLVITTCMTSRSLRFLPRDFFSHIMLDEAAQMREPENIIPLCLATSSTKIVVAGDPNQVGPATIVLGEKTQLSTSLLERLHSTYVQLGDLASSYVVTLMNNYRCNSSILKLVGDLYYDFPLMWAQHQPSPPLHPDAPYPLLFICSSVDENESKTSTINRQEAEIVLEEVIDKAKRWPPAWRSVDLSQFCIMSPNRAQMTLIQQIMREKKLSNQLKKLILLTTIEIQGREYRGIFLSTSEPTEEDSTSFDHRRSLADRYVFNTAITRAQSLVVSVGNPFSLLKLEKHMILRYGEKGKCWSSYLRSCIENGTMTFHKSLGLTPDGEASCLSKIMSLVEEHCKPSTTMVEKETMKGMQDLVPLEQTPMQEPWSAQVPMPQPIMQIQAPHVQSMPQSTLSLSHSSQQPVVEYLGQTAVPPIVPANLQQQQTTNTISGFQEMQPNQFMSFPTNTSSHHHTANGEVHNVQSSQPMMFPSVTGGGGSQLHSMYMPNQAQVQSQANYPNSLFNIFWQHNYPAIPLNETSQISSQAQNQFEPDHGNFNPESNFQSSLKNPPLPDSTKSKENISQAVSQIELKQSPTATENTNVPCSIHICNITEHYDTKIIQLYFESAMSGGGEVKSVEMLENGAAVVTLKFMNPEVIERVLQKNHDVFFGPNTTVTVTKCQAISSDLATIQEHQVQDVEPIASCPSIRLLNVTLHYDKDYIELYFEKCASSVQVEMMGNGEATIRFDKLEDVEAALRLPLNKFGEKATAERICTDTTKDPKAKDHIEISIQQLKAECLARDPSGLLDHLSSLHVQVTVQVGQENFGKVTITSTELTKAEWQEEAKQEVEAYIKTKLLARTKKTQLANSEEGITELREYVKQLKANGCFAYEFKKENTQLRFAGDEESVKQCELKMKEIVEGFKMVEEDVPLSHDNYDFLKRIKLSEIEGKFPEVSVTHDSKTPALKLKGMRKAVQKFKTAVKEDGEHKTLLVPLDKQVVEYFQTKMGKFVLKEVLKTSSCAVVPRFLKCEQTSSITLNLLCNPSQESAASTVVESLQRAIDFKRIQLPESLVVIQEEVSEEYTTLCRSFEEQYSVIVKRSKEDISFAGKMEHVSQCDFELRAFVKQKCAVKEDVRFEGGIWKLFNGHLKEKWVSLITRCKQTEVQLKMPEASSKAFTSMQVTLTGDRIPVKKICNAITELLKSTCKEVITVDSPGTMKYFQSKNTTRSLKSIQTERKVVIEVIDPSEKVTEDSIVDKDVPETCKQARKHLAPLGGGKQVAIFVGDITVFDQADVLVNAANINLEHNGGVAKAISDRGGPIIQSESLQHVKQNGKLQTGEAWLTTKTGGLPCKALVHTVGPIWASGKKNEEAQLVNACMNTLKCVHEKGYTSVAFPAISAGIYGYPMDQCARVMIRSIITFHKDSPTTSIQEYNIVLFKNEDAIPFVATLKRLLSDGAEKGDSSPVSNSQPSKPKTWSQLPITDHPKHQPFHVPSVQRSLEERKIGRSVYQTIDTDHKSIKSKMLEHLKLHKGSIVGIKADVYVNTTNKNLNLSDGGVSKALLKEGGQSLQQECSQKAPIAKYGEIVVTGAGNLQCQYVLHTVLPSHDSGEAERILRKVVRKCMQTCELLCVQSVAFPAIGTGNLGYPDDFVAKIMVEEVHRYFMMRNPLNILVHFVIFMESTYAAFRKELQSLGMNFKHQQPHQAALTSRETRPHSLDTSTTSVQQVYRYSKPVPVPTVPLSKKTSIRHRSTVPFRSVASCLGSTAVQHTSNQNVTFAVGDQHLTVTIVIGDITEETSDVIVNCTNSQLKLAQGVAGALRQKGGPQLQQLCDIEMEKRGQPLRGDKIIETHATGRLKCRSIFHVHFDQKTPSGFVQLVVACLQRAQTKGYSTISFPAIGTGGGGYPPEAAASGMLKAINSFSQHCLASLQPCSMKSVRIVLFKDQTLFNTFDTTFKSTLHKHDSPNESLTSSETESESEDDTATVSVSNLLKETEETASVELGQVSDESDEESSGEEYCIKKLEIKIYGESEDVVKAAKQEVQDMVNENLVDDIVEISITDKLPRAEKHNFRREGKKHSVQVIIDEDSQQSIQLSGFKDDVTKVKFHITKELTKLKERNIKEKAAEHLYQTIRWRKEDSTGSKSEYDQNINHAIEMAYKDHCDRTKPTYLHGSPETPLYFTIDFVQMKETDHHANDTQVKVTRVNIEVEKHLQKDEYPSHWSPMPRDGRTGKEQSLDSVLLDPNSDEYKEIESEFDKTMSSNQHYAVYGVRRYYSRPSYRSIVKILRIQNPVLYATYLAKKRAMEKMNTSGNVIERRLFHGTAGDTCATINRSGFNRSYAGKNATALGKGVYFARDASYSAANPYSPPDHRGHKNIYFARVLTGEYTIGNSSMLEPPQKDLSDESSARYDSVTNSIHDPSIFVIFNDTSAYPEYLIVFRPGY